MSTIAEFEFDRYPPLPPKGAVVQPTTSKLVLNDDDDCQLGISLRVTGKEDVVLVHTFRDQWGVFIDIAGISIAQEDDTRSFLDAFAKALMALRQRIEITTDASVTVYESNEQ